MATRVNIEYSPQSGFEPRFRLLEQEIRAAVPKAIVSGSPGRPDAFEVTMNDQLLFSRLQTGRFPPNDDIVERVREACALCCTPGYQQQQAIPQQQFQQTTIPQSSGISQPVAPSVVLPGQEKLSQTLQQHQQAIQQQLALEQQQAAALRQQQEDLQQQVDEEAMRLKFEEARLRDQAAMHGALFEGQQQLGQQAAALQQQAQQLAQQQAIGQQVLQQKEQDIHRRVEKEKEVIVQQTQEQLQNQALAFQQLSEAERARLEQEKQQMQQRMLAIQDQLARQQQLSAAERERLERERDQLMQQLALGKAQQYKIEQQLRQQAQELSQAQQLEAARLAQEQARLQDQQRQLQFQQQKTQQVLQQPIQQSAIGASKPVEVSSVVQPSSGVREVPVAGGFQTGTNVPVQVSQPITTGAQFHQQPIGQQGIIAGARSSSSSSSSSPESEGMAKQKKPSRKLLSGEKLGLQQGPKARQQREFRMVPEGDVPFQGPPVGQQSTAMGQSHPYGSIGGQAADKDLPYQRRGNVPAAEAASMSAQGAYDPNLQQQPQESKGLGSKILGALGLGKHKDKDKDRDEDITTATAGTSSYPTSQVQQPTLVPTEYQQQEFEKFKQAGHIPNQQDIGQHKAQRTDFKEQTGYMPTTGTSLQQPYQTSAIQQPIGTTIPQPIGVSSLEGPVVAGSGLQQPYQTGAFQQPIGASSGLQQPMGVGALGAGATGMRRASSSSSSSSSGAEGQEKLSKKEKKQKKKHTVGTMVKELRSVVDRPGTTADQKHNLDTEAIRGASYIRRENVREQT